MCIGALNTYRAAAEEGRGTEKEREREREREGERGIERGMDVERKGYK